MTDTLIDKARELRDRNIPSDSSEWVRWVSEASDTMDALISRLEAAEKVCIAVEDEERVLESDDWSTHTNFYNLMRERLGAWRAIRDASTSQEGT